MTTSAERMARYRDRRRAAGLPLHTEGEKASRQRYKSYRPFVGCDGEGAGTDAMGRQNYMLFRMGERELFTGSPLTTGDILDFICEADAKPLYVGFSFGYDTTQILRGLKGDRITRLFVDKDAGAGKSRYTWTGLYGLEYIPRNYFRVCRLQPGRKLVDGQWQRCLETVPGSARTIYDTFAFFQTSFVKALAQWEIGTPGQREAIAAGKLRRGQIPDLTQQDRDYCALECDLLADMMEDFRTACYETITPTLPEGIRPRTWNGAGKLAGYLHDKHKTPTKELLDILIAEPVRLMASDAYYGGRFEVFRVGELHDLYEHDIKSAYPRMMEDLPCLVHGKWHEAGPAKLKQLWKDPSALFVANMSFTHVTKRGQRVNLYGLPVRRRDGRLTWPKACGDGTYWSPELRAAAKLGMKPSFKSGFFYEKRCDCRPFEWVRPLFDHRVKMGKNKRGMPLKYGINALYGRLAQRIGNPRWANMIWAGLITAMTRAALVEAAAQAPESVAMMATDGLYATKRLALPEGDQLGDWEIEHHDRVFIVQPGIYWGTAKPKTRGVNPSFFEAEIDRPDDAFVGPLLPRYRLFEDAWAAYAEADRAAVRPGSHATPEVALPVELFIGLRLAAARGKPETAGKWDKTTRSFKFDWTKKRTTGTWETPLCHWTFPQPGGADTISHPHGGLKQMVAELDLERAELDEQRDHFDMGPGFMKED